MSSAKYVATLLEYDVPEIVRLKRKKTNIIAICLIGVPKAPEYLAITVRAGDWERFISDRCDVRYLFTTPIGRAAYAIKGAALSSEKVFLEKFESPIDMDWLPDQGMFASELSNLEEFEDSSQSVAKLNLDGEWDSADFGHLQRKISDVYSFLLAIDESSGISQDRLKRCIYDKPLAGGSSYGSLFGDVRNVVPYTDRLRLKAIQKASPGYMLLKADNDAFSEMRSIVRYHQNNRAKARTIYLELRKTLTDDKMLRSKISNYSSTYVNDGKIEELAKRLFAEFGVVNAERVREMTEGNNLAFSKIAMAFFRRVDEAMLYFAEGRASFEEGSAST